VSNERSYGVLALSYREPQIFPDEQIALAVAFANQAMLAIESARLSEQVQTAAAAEERQRLARELHDAVTQTLFSTSLIAEVVPDLWESRPEFARQKLEDLRRLTKGALAEMRTLLIELRPSALIELSLGELLNQLAEATAAKAKLRMSVDIRALPPESLPPDVQVALYRMAQEAVNNIVRHAQAKEGVITLDAAGGAVSLSVSDDGRGFDPLAVPGGHLGVRIMRERAQAIGAEFGLESAPGRGTQITVEWRSPDGDQHRPG
jgi:signal transduction histidine kinase